MKIIINSKERVIYNKLNQAQHAGTSVFENKKP